MHVESESRARFRVLLVEDEPVAARLLTAALEALGGAVVPARSLREAQRRMADAPLDLCLLDLALPDGSGLQLLEALGRSGIPAIVQTASDRAALAVEAMRAGAADFLVKPVTPQRLARAVDAVLSAARGSRAEDDRAAPMARALRLADKVAGAHVPVLLTGETGVGKEWLARRIVRAGPRAEAPFLALNCAALPTELAESLLFGHERGSFSGAAERHAGRFAEADGGTLLLDEIAELPLALQAKLLRTLESGEIDPVGARRPRRVDVRILAATHRDLGLMVREGTFRADLYWRLAVFEIAIPPLRERQDEIAALAVRFAAEEGQGVRRLAIPADTLRRLAVRPWPGNIRELRHAVQRAAILSDGDTLGPAEFELEDEAPPDAGLASASAARDGAGGEGAPAPISDRFLGADGRPRPLDEVERAAIRAAIRFHGGSLAAAARSLRISRSTLYRKLAATGTETGDRDVMVTSATDFTGR